MTTPELDLNFNQIEPLLADQKRVPGARFESIYEVQNKILKGSRVNLDGIVKLTAPNSGTADFSLGSALNLASTISFDSPQQNKKTFGHPFVSIYQGSAPLGSNQIYPNRGGSVTIGRYTVQADHNYHNYNGTFDNWQALLVDTTGTNTQVIAFYAQWIFIDYTAQDAR